MRRKVKIVSKEIKKIQKSSIKILKQMDEKVYKNFQEKPQLCSVNYGGFGIDTNIHLEDKFLEIQNLLKFMDEVNFVKTSKEWTVKLIVCFMVEMIGLNKFIMNTEELSSDERDEAIKTIRKNIRARYRVSSLTTYMNQFIKRTEANTAEGEELRKYICREQILFYKYGNNLEKLQKDTEENKISEKDLAIIKKIYEV